MWKAGKFLGIYVRYKGYADEEAWATQASRTGFPEVFWLTLSQKSISYPWQRAQGFYIHYDPVLERELGRLGIIGPVTHLFLILFLSDPETFRYHRTAWGLTGAGWMLAHETWNSPERVALAMDDQPLGAILIWHCVNAATSTLT